MPNPVGLKKFMIKDADISVITTIDGTISLVVGVNYVAATQTGVEVPAELEEIAGKLQTCLTCLKAQLKSSKSILIHDSDCTSCYQSCLEQKEVCVECQEKGLESIEPQLHPCEKCLSNKKTVCQVFNNCLFIRL